MLVVGMRKISVLKCERALWVMEERWRCGWHLPAIYLLDGSVSPSCVVVHNAWVVSVWFSSAGVEDQGVAVLVISLFSSY